MYQLDEFAPNLKTAECQNRKDQINRYDVRPDFGGTF